MNKVVISILGQDRAGIIAAVSGVLQQLGINIENVSQTILQSVFGALFMVSAPRDLDPDTLRETLRRELEQLHLDIFVKQYADVVPEPVREQATSPFVITSFGPDRRGLVLAITRVLARHHVNVTTLKAVFKGGEDPRDNVMIFEVDVPEEVPLPELRRELQQAGDGLQLDINIQHRKIFETMNRI